MKVTFIQPYYHNVWSALGLGYIIAYCKKHYKGDLEINFFQGKFDLPDDIVNGSFDSDIVAFSCTSPAYTWGLTLAKSIKLRRQDTHIVFGGWHPTALPMDVFQEDCVDQVIIGEGEHAMLRILNGERIEILQGDKLPPEELPWPDREAIKCERTISLAEEMTGYRIASFQAHRGCPFQCPFCAEKYMTGKYHKTNNPIRTRDISDVLDEIQIVKYKYNIGYF
ncbi:MAG: B12-binding domain-containing radical SAM protein, partial [Candidatus Scalindua sp.]